MPDLYHYLQQLPEEDQRSGATDAPEFEGGSAFDAQADTDGAEFQAQYRVGDDQHQQGAENRGFEILGNGGAHTFSTSGRPRMPVGRNSSTSTSRLNATTSLY